MEEGSDFVHGELLLNQGNVQFGNTIVVRPLVTGVVHVRARVVWGALACKFKGRLHLRQCFSRNSTRTDILVNLLMVNESTGSCGALAPFLGALGLASAVGLTCTCASISIF